MTRRRLPGRCDLAGRAVRDLARHSRRDLERWIGQVHALRGCREPIRLAGETLTLDARTGQLLTHYTTAAEPHGQLMVRCKNRRASRCPACAEEYRADTFHLIRAGLAGGDKGVPETVRTHPRVLATLTAPSFGPVHLSIPGPDGRPRPCYPRRNDPDACWARHGPDDPCVGQPINPDTYDYHAHVLWNAYAGQLWRRFITYLPRHLAKATGRTLRDLRQEVRISFAKVAEYQRRGVVHFHAIIRLDGRDIGDDDDDEDGSSRDNGGVPLPPQWATLDALDAAIRAAAAAARLEAPVPSLARSIELRWGRQVDVQPVNDLSTSERLTEEAVAGYIAKYATKATEATGALNRPVTRLDLHALRRHGVPAHTVRLIRACWDLGEPAHHPELVHLKLRRWCHMLGFRGHFTTKSRRYSTTLTALRRTRADYCANRAGRPRPNPDTTLVLAHWRYAGQGYTPGESLLAANLAPAALRANVRKPHRTQLVPQNNPANPRGDPT